MRSFAGYAAQEDMGHRPDNDLTRAAGSLSRQTQEAADAKSRGCLTCHEGVEPMHASAAVKLGCTDCHGGDAGVSIAAGVARGSADYDNAERRAHVAPRYPEIWSRNGHYSSANPARTYTALLRESPEFVRFINPGDLRVAAESCGECHPRQVAAVPRSTMTTSAVFWAAASYANGVLSRKVGLLGESYNRDGQPQLIKPAQPSTPEQIAHGALPLLVPMPRWEVIQPGEYFRAFERGGILGSSMPPEIGNPGGGDEAGRPDIRLGSRGRGTGLRISPALINLQKTRLNDPHLSFLGTNDHPGDYRSSGCTACHVVYANDRDPLHSAGYAQFGNNGRSRTADATIPKDESGHPLRHQFTRAVPTSQCMSCHMHQPNSFVNTYLGYTMWDYETDADLLFPKKQRYPTESEKRASLDHNPEGAAVRGLWTDIAFLENVRELNAQAKNTQFADYHGHGWNFMAVYKRDRKGNLLDAAGKQVAFDDPKKFEKAVHLQDIHLEKGMHCADCHFSQDEHGDGQIYAEYGNNIEIECQDCHGTIDRYTTLRTSGPAAPPGGHDLRLGTTPFGRLRFAWVNGTLWQRSMLTPDLQWEVVQVKDTITPGHPRYNERSRYAKTLQRDGATWGMASDAGKLAHSDQQLTCYACHTSWMTSCSGCHLPQEQNAKTEMHHYEGIETRNYASYNPQVIRTDAFMIGVNGTTKGHKIAPVRSSSALVLSSTNALRDRIYVQQPPISAPGYSSQAFNPHVPHTVRSRETQGCGSCHVTKENDNNAWLAQVFLQGTNFVNFIGRNAWVGEEGGLEAIAVTEWDEPQTVIGSSLHKIVYPDLYARHQERKLELETAHRHHGNARSIQLRGEYLFTANGEEGFEVYDVANIDNKDFSERIVSAPVSPLGQRTYVPTKFASAVALPTTMPVAPNRKTQFIPENEEQPIHPLYRYAYVADREEGLILVDVTTLTDGNPSNNFLTRALTFNPDGALKGAESIAVAGRWVYIGCDRGLVVIDIDKPLEPRIVATLADVPKPRSIAVQFRYAFVANEKGLQTIDVTDPASPRLAASLPIADARSVYVARTYAYVGAGAQGMIIVDVENPQKPLLDQTFTADGALRDTNDVKVASTNASTYAYVADGKYGFKVVQLTSPEWTPTYAGFSPRPAPRLIATRKTRGAAQAVSKGLDRDRAVDESGNQVSIFNRIGARPMTLPEMQRLYLRGGRLYTVSDTPETAAVAPPSDATQDSKR
ncbi:MAG TPA: hypothetical protein VEZ11_16505 [Thermoanaerobaculia bacterium]|nr:hypothetical protein [Thermoanaerobaculia bacterium]